MNAKQRYLFYNGTAWNKYGPNRDIMFDVTQGSYDGAESAELYGLFLLK